MPFQKGNQLGRGRPRTKDSLTASLRIALAEKLPDGRSNYRAVADALVERGREGDIAAIREIFDRVEGKVMAKVSIDTRQPRPINIQVTPLDKGLL